MSNLQRVTLTLPADVLTQARELSQGNLSQFVANMLSEHFEYERLRQLRDDLIASCIANAEEDLEIAEAFRYAEDEAVRLYVPLYTEDDPEAFQPPVLSGQEH